MLFGGATADERVGVEAGGEELGSDGGKDAGMDEEPIGSECAATSSDVTTGRGCW